MTELDIIRHGPLLKNSGFSENDVEREQSKWIDASKLILDALQFDAQQLTEAQKNRVFHYYLPIVMWIQRLKAQHNGTGPMMLGISAPQGCGKSTLVECLYKVFGKMGMKSACVSIDDFYLTREDQKTLASENSDNPLLQCRGNAMTHDMTLGTATLQKLKGLSETGSAAVPRYDKSAFDGKGDRMAEEHWIKVDGPLDLILFEGWMLGFRSRSADDVSAVDPHLVPINAALKEYANAWDAYVDAWLVIKVADPVWVGEWRLQAEKAMKQMGKSGMSDEAVQAFVNCYMPAYKAYLPELYSKGPTTASSGKCLIIEVDDTRSPITQQPEQIII